MEEKDTIKTFQEAQALYPNIIDMSEEFSNPAPSESEVLAKLREMLKDENGYATATPNKKLRIFGNREKLQHISKGDNYRNDNNATRKFNRKLAFFSEKIITNAEFIEAELPISEKNKEYLLGMHNYEVPIYVNGHGYLIRLEGEVIKNASDFSPGNKALKQNTYVESDSNNNNNEILLKLQAVEVSNLYVMRKQKVLFNIENKLSQEINMENTTNINNLNSLKAAEYLTQKINASGINIHLSKEEMKAILEAGENVQKLAVKYGTNQNIESENENSFNGYGTYVVSVNEENARQLGIKIASRKYGGTFYINNQPLNDFLQEKNFSPYWLKRLEQFNSNSVDNLAHEILMANVGGNPTLEKEQTALTTLLSLDLVEYKREQTYLYSVDIPDNDNTNYLLYNNPIGLEQATKINNELEKMGVEWRASRNDIGKNIYFELLSKKVFDGNQKLASEFLKENVGFVGMQMDNVNYIIFNDKDMSINNRVQYMKSENGEVYGFTFDGEIYIDEDLLNSNVLAHEYTHIWDNYVQKNNPELWQKGMTCLKGTSLWYEITEDKNYENLRTDDEILSECHARIVGKMAEQVLERIAARDGELTKDKIIDWDKEVNEYVATELLIKPELGEENYISESVKAEYLKEFLSMPMKDLMNEVRINEFGLKKISSKPNKQIGKTSISSESLSFPIEPQLSIGPRANHIILQNDTERQAIIKKLDKIKTEKIEPREFLIKLKEAYGFKDKDSSDYVANRINNSKFALRISNHSVNAHYVEKKYVETSIVIRLSYNRFHDEKDKYVAEFNYAPEMLTPEKKQEIIENLKTWTLTGQYPEKDIKPKYSPNEEEWKKANETMLNFVKNSKGNTKIQKYAETIDNPQTENPEESVEKSSKESDIQKEETAVSEEKKELSEKEITGIVPEIVQEQAMRNLGFTLSEKSYKQYLSKMAESFFEIKNENKWNCSENEKEFLLKLKEYKGNKDIQQLDNENISEFLKTDFYENNKETVANLYNLVYTKKEERTEEFHFAKELSEKEEKFDIFFGQTKIPEVAMITQHGLQTYKNLTIETYNETEKSFLLRSEDGKSISVTENTLKELISEKQQEKAQKFDENTKAAEKMLETQYNDFFETRKNTANNFRHNLSVLCRKEANSPLDALKIASSIISQMPKEEKSKTKDLLNLLRKDGQTVNEVLIETYHEAVKDVPLNEEYLNTEHKLKTKNYGNIIVRKMYDTISDKGQKLDKDFNLKIGDSVSVNFKVDKAAGTSFSLKKENLFQECTIISSSKEANKVTLMDGNKSFYDVPRDSFLQEYAKREKIEHKQEQKNQHSRSMEIEMGR